LKATKVPAPTWGKERKKITKIVKKGNGFQSTNGVKIKTFENERGE